jgi:hypothetical protein
MREASKIPIPIYILKNELENSLNEASIDEMHPGSHTQAKALA